MAISHSRKIILTRFVFVYTAEIAVWNRLIRNFKYFFFVLLFLIVKWKKIFRKIVFWTEQISSWATKECRSSFLCLNRVEQISSNCGKLVRWLLLWGFRLLGRWRSGLFALRNEFVQLGHLWTLLRRQFRSDRPLELPRGSSWRLERGDLSVRA